MDLAGVRFGRLTAQRRTTKGKRVAWECVCDCDTVTITAQLDLRSGDSTSCGCRKSDVTIRRNTTHSMTSSKIYSKWKGMWARVRSAHRLENRCYIGVTVCPRWADFENFLADMGEMPDGYSLDRIDNTKGYSKENCRWVPLVEEARNTRRLRMYEGRCISEAARQAGLAPGIVFDRINKLGWGIDRALATPQLRKKRSGN